MQRNAIGAWVLQGLLAAAFLLQSSAMPALILLTLNALVVWLRRDQLAAVLAFLNLKRRAA